VLLGLLRAGDGTTLKLQEACDLTAADVRRAVGEADRRPG
jgi:hypothetical protein